MDGNIYKNYRLLSLVIVFIHGYYFKILLVGFIHKPLVKYSENFCKLQKEDDHNHQFMKLILLNKPYVKPLKLFK